MAGVAVVEKEIVVLMMHDGDDGMKIMTKTMRRHRCAHNNAYTET